MTVNRRAIRAVFLDRDGTLAPDVNYCRCPDDFHLFNETPQAIKLLNDAGFKVIIITNQSGIARGYFTEETLAEIHQKMKDELRKKGAYIDAIYYCPHHPDDDCECRKPKTGLFLQAAAHFHFDLGGSFVVGDMQADIAAGKTLGCKTIAVNAKPQAKPGIVDSADYTADNLLEAVNWILK
jgi:histidinol-phosphate phosphatase family protein